MSIAPPLSTLPRVVLKPRRARPFFGRHPWVLAGAIQETSPEIADGAEVDLHTHEGEFIARGLYNSHSNIRVRLYTWDAAQSLDAPFWHQRLRRALHLRHRILGLEHPEAACRLVFSEADGLSGLIVDRYAQWLIVQFTSLAMAQRQQIILDELVDVLQPKGVYLRTERGIGELEGLVAEDRVLYGDVPETPVFISEHGLRFGVDLRQGQKTGFFLDQRDNRAAVVPYLAGRRVLDAFCYSGAFAVAAAVKGHARHVNAFDVSASAITLARLNAQLNAAENIDFETADAFDVLQRYGQAGTRFGAIILDPPRFARHRRAVDEAIRAHTRLNRLAVELLEDDGILVTCCCAAHVSRELFEQMLATVAESTGRSIQVLERRGQAPDHPMAASCWENDYLKCYICRNSGG